MHFRAGDNRPDLGFYLQVACGFDCGQDFPELLESPLHMYGFILLELQRLLGQLGGGGVVHVVRVVFFRIADDVLQAALIESGQVGLVVVIQRPETFRFLRSELELLFDEGPLTRSDL